MGKVPGGGNSPKSGVFQDSCGRLRVLRALWGIQSLAASLGFLKDLEHLPWWHHG